ncbi:unnamed protein product, partial [Meganyctiphanes norvegica]
TDLRAKPSFVQFCLAIRADDAYLSEPVTLLNPLKHGAYGPSSPPVSVECSAGAGGHTLVVRWLPPPEKDHNGILLDYHLMLTNFQDFSGRVEEVSRRIRGSEETVESLRPWTNYSVTVAATTRAGTGPPSPDITCMTAEDVSGTPSGVRALQSAPGSALVTWLPPNPPTGVLTGYTLYHRSPHTNTATKYALHALATSHTLDRLIRGMHEIWMTARTRVGEGKPSQVEKLNIIQKEKVPYRILANDGLVMSWLKSRLQNPRISLTQRYIWSARLINFFQPPLAKTERGGILKFFIKNVETYLLGRASGSFLQGWLSTKVVTLYFLCIPLSPSSPSVLIAEATSSTLSVSWSVEDTGGAAVRSWALWWRPANGGQPWLTTELGRTATKHTIRDLQCGKEYQVYMTVTTSVGISPPSEPLTARTSGSPPIPPPTRRVATSNSSSVMVWLGRWEDGGCPITHYMLEIRHPQDSSWTTLASSLAPQEVYAVGGLLQHSTFGLRLTGNNAAGTTTTTVSISTGPGMSLASLPLESLQNPSLTSLHSDPRLLASAATSALALSLTIAAAVLCLKRRGVDQENNCARDTKDSEDNKNHLLHQQDGHYATIRKPQPVPDVIGRIPENSEDIYPYATFQLRDKSFLKDHTKAAKFQSIIYQDDPYGVTEGRPPATPTSGKQKCSHRTGGLRSESEEYDSMQSDSETELAISSRTESSNQLECATLESHAHLQYLPLDSHVLKPAPTSAAATAAASVLRPEPGHRRTSIKPQIHKSNMATETNPVYEMKPISQRVDLSKRGQGGVFKSTRDKTSVNPTIIQETSISHIKKKPNVCNKKGNVDQSYGFNCKINPPVAFSNELSSAECDGENLLRHQNIENIGRVGHPNSRFRSYVGNGKENKDFSIKV